LEHTILFEQIPSFSLLAVQPSVRSVSSNGKAEASITARLDITAQIVAVVRRSSHGTLRRQNSLSEISKVTSNINFLCSSSLQTDGCTYLLRGMTGSVMCDGYCAL
jgi:hypothetical protein